MDHIIKSVIAAGIVIGILSGTPFIEFGNCFCCMWVIAGGILGAFLHKSFSGKGTGPGKGILIGVFAGAIGAILKVCLTTALLAAGLSSGDFIGPRLISLIPKDVFEEHLRKLPPEKREEQRLQIERLRSGKMPKKIDWKQIPVQAGVTLFMYLIFAAVGGLIGGLLVPAIESGGSNSNGSQAPPNTAQPALQASTETSKNRPS